MARKEHDREFHSVDSVPAKLSIIVGENLRALRRKHGLSLEQLAHLSGVSRAMLGQIETGKSAPTINLLGRIAEALKVSVPSLISNSQSAGTVIIPRDRSTVLASGDGGFTCRALFPWGDVHSAEIYEVSIAPEHFELAPPLAPGAKKSLVVISGEIEVSVAGDSPVRLSTGDAILFSADAEHRLHNPSGAEAKAFLVITGNEPFTTRPRPV